MTDTSFEIFLVTPPGLEDVLRAEVAALGFGDPQVVKGGVVIQGGWPEVWRANLEVRGASRVVARVAAFRAMHLAQLDKRARKVAWGKVLRADVAVSVEATCSGSRIYHAKAAAQRLEQAVAETLGVPVSPEAPIRVMARLDDDWCTLSVDTSGELLHRRQHKEAVNKAPLRETLAALFLRACGYDGQEAVVDPMCGSGTFVIEAAEMAAGLPPGRSRTFAFEQMATFDPEAWSALRQRASEPLSGVRFFGSDRDPGAIRMSRANAERAQVADVIRFQERPVSDLWPPAGLAPGLVMVNPPYGTRLGDKRELKGLYQTLGRRLRSYFQGWRVGLITSEATLAQATGLPFLPPGPVISHGGVPVRLYRTDPL
ncbi:THUMP domain-containing class I SAM-dependent RNA methyltransferase [Pararhodospirillum photometricum]|nr:RNA methyltransferase [Pararhodospirillum photometricum]